VSSSGPLRDVRVVDVSALAPGPFCSMILADFGADVIAVESVNPPQFDVASFFSRGKRSILADLRHPDGVAAVARLAASADVFVEGYRPGTMERLGLGPDDLHRINPGLVYTRLTGWGQSGPYADRAGHDLNYVAVAGVLGALAGEGHPQPPLNLLGDFAGGSVMAAFGTVMALFDRARTGLGQVVDAAMVDGAAQLLSAQLALFSRGRWPSDEMLDGSAPYYRCYRCADGRSLAVGAVEPKFYRAFLDTVGADPALVTSQFDRQTWAATSGALAALVECRSRSEWLERFAGVDACVTPVLDLAELEGDPHLAARGTIVSGDGGIEAAPAPRLSGHPWGGRPGVTPRGRDTVAVLAEAGLSPDEIDELLRSGAAAEAAEPARSGERP